MPTRETTIPEDLLQQMRLKGRISGSEGKGNNGEGKPKFFQTYVMVPAPDAYSHPSTYGVNASAPLGPDGQDVDIICNVSPYNKRGKDGNLYCNNSLWLFVEDDKEKDVSF